MSTTVRPASNVYCNTDGRWMTCGILNVDTHYRILSAHTLRSKADGIDTILEKLLHFCCVCVIVVRTDRTHQRFLGVQSSCLYRCSYTNTNKKWRTRIQSVSCHLIQNEIGNTLITGTWHQNHCFSRKGTSAACHVCVDLTFIAVWNNIPPYSRCSLTNVFLCIVLIKSLNGIMS